MRDNLREGEGGSFGVETALDDLQIGCDGSEIVVGRFVGQIAQAQRLADLPWGE